MADSYHINDNDQVVPYSGGRMDTSTDSWRDATELELTQRAEIVELEEQIEQLRIVVCDYEYADRLGSESEV